MKSFISACIIFILFIMASNLYNNELEKSSDRFEKQINAVEAAVNNNDWNTVDIKIQELECGWKSLQSWLKAVISHYEINMIEQTLCEIKGYIDTKENNEVLVRIDLLKMLSRRIVDNEKITLTNIL